jgi:hypothetical protein
MTGENHPLDFLKTRLSLGSSLVVAPPAILRRVDPYGIPLNGLIGTFRRGA